jgi:anti-sigma regulatory factor (Ser/Thr protein kinase)
MTSDLVRLRVPCDPTAPRQVRHALDRVPELAPVHDDALLIASELVTNAILHSGCGGEDWLEVGVERSGDSVRICVADPGESGTEAIPRPAPRADRAGGWGLALVSRVAQRWGTERTETHSVWAELGLPT